MAKPVDLWVVANVVVLIGSSIGVSVFLSTMSIAPWTAAGVTLVCTSGIAFATGLVKTSDVRHLYARMRSNEAQS
jgi:hypothetical protein